MTIDLIKQFEAVPAAYPAAPSGLSTAAAALNAGMIWARIEAYTAWRFTEREVVWTLLGDGGDQWHPPLTPLVSREAHFWGDQWEALTLLDGPLGICLPYDGTYRITAPVMCLPRCPRRSGAWRNTWRMIRARRARPVRLSPLDLFKRRWTATRHGWRGRCNLAARAICCAITGDPDHVAIQAKREDRNPVERHGIHDADHAGAGRLHHRR